MLCVNTVCQLFQKKTTDAIKDRIYFDSVTLNGHISVILNSYVCVYVCMYVLCMYVCMYALCICMYIYIYICVYLYTVVS